MKTRNKVVLIVAVTVVALLIAPAAIQARAIITEYTGTEACVPVNLGVWTTSDGIIHIRGMVLQCSEDSSDPRAAGQNTVIMNANWHADPDAVMGGTGPMWGTWQMENWTGTWEGTMLVDGGVYHAQGKGTGIYDGLKLWIDSDHEVISGRILDPHGGD